MEFKKYMSEKDNLKAANRLLKFFVVIIGIATVVNLFLASSMLSKQKIILVPPIVSSQSFILASDASDEYLVSMSRYIATLAFTYSPATARTQFDTLLKMFAPSVVAQAKNSWYDLASRIEAGGVSSAFFVTKVSVVREKRELHIQGILDQWTQEKQFITNETKVYVVKYRIENGLFMIEELKEQLK